MSLVVLRKCQYCGLEAKTPEDLESFTKAKRYLYRRRNICKPCFASLLRKGGRYHESHAKSCLSWYGVGENRERHVEAMRRRITFRGKRIILTENPRTGICSECRAVITEKQTRQATMHHEYYDEDKPDDGTTERCDSCHTRFHDARRREEIQQGKRKGWNDP